MNDDSRNKLEMFEYLLDQDEEWFRRELDSAKRMIGQNPEQPAPAPREAASAKTAPVRNYANGYGQSKPRVQKPAPEKEETPVPKGIGGLLILASLEALGILGLVVYWLTVLLR